MNSVKAEDCKDMFVYHPRLIGRAGQGFEASPATEPRRPGAASWSLQGQAAASTQHPAQALAPQRLSSHVLHLVSVKKSYCQQRSPSIN